MRSLENGVLPPRLREAVALRVAQINRADYCLAAHTAKSRRLGVPYADTIDFRIGVSDDPLEQAALDFAGNLVFHRGRHSASDLEKLARRGLSEEASLEIIAHVAMNMFTNMLTSAVGLEPDFPRAQSVGETTDTVFPDTRLASAG